MITVNTMMTASIRIPPDWSPAITPITAPATSAIARATRSNVEAIKRCIWKSSGGTRSVKNQVAPPVARVRCAGEEVLRATYPRAPSGGATLRDLRPYASLEQRTCHAQLREHPRRPRRRGDTSRMQLSTLEIRAEREANADVSDATVEVRCAGHLQAIEVEALIHVQRAGDERSALHEEERRP